MTLGMIKNVIGTAKGELMFYDGYGVEVINENTCGHYRKDRKGRMTLDGDVRLPDVPVGRQCPYARRSPKQRVDSDP